MELAAGHPPAWPRAGGSSEPEGFVLIGKKKEQREQREQRDEVRKLRNVGGGRALLSLWELPNVKNGEFPFLPETEGRGTAAAREA